MCTTWNEIYGMPSRKFSFYDFSKHALEEVAPIQDRSPVLVILHALSRAKYATCPRILVRLTIATQRIGTRTARPPNNMGDSQLHRSNSSITGISQVPHTVLPTWEADIATSLCPLCSIRFSFFLRKHHCRSCGRVVCHACSSQTLLLPPLRVVRPLDVSYFRPEEREERVRCCDGCFSRAEQERCRRTLLASSIARHQRRDSAHQHRVHAVATGRWASNSSRDMIASYGGGSGSQTDVGMSPPPEYSVRRGMDHSQANMILTDLREAELREGGLLVLPDGRLGVRRTHPSHSHEYIRSRPNPVQSANTDNSPRPDALDSGLEHVRLASLHPSSANTVMPLRYVPFRIAESDKMVGEECCICLEEYRVGDKIARLECWCIFHLTCIRAWRDQKDGPGGCPLHFHD